MVAWDKSASQGKESVLADSGRVGEIFAGVGRVGKSRAVKDSLGRSLNQDMENRKTWLNARSLGHHSDLGSIRFFPQIAIEPALQWSMTVKRAQMVTYRLRGEDHGQILRPRQGMMKEVPSNHVGLEHEVPNSRLLHRRKNGVRLHIAEDGRRHHIGFYRQFYESPWPRLSLEVSSG